MEKVFTTNIAGKDLIIKTGILANQATKSVSVRYQDTEVLVTVTMSETPREGVDFLPLLVDYEEKLYAAGKIKSSRFLKREGRPSDEAILTARLIDRSVRPLFNKNLRQDIQIVVTVFSIDQVNDPDILGIIGASIALASSKIPWNGLISAVRVGMINGEYVLNPSYEIREKSIIDLVISVTDEGKIIMLEGSGKEISEEDFLKVVEYGRKHSLRLIEFIKKVVDEIKEDKLKVEKEVLEGEVELRKFIDDNIEKYFYTNFLKTKNERKKVIKKFKEELDKFLEEKGYGKEKREKVINKKFKEYLEYKISDFILSKNKRVDGRGIDEIREIDAKVSIFPRTHGSALFTRGETQVVSVVTLGAPGEEQILETIEESSVKRFMHHYNFPPYSVGEVKPLGFPSRREIGHGALVEKALKHLIPKKEKFPYTIRVVSEVLSSNGSSSMGSVCGSSLALMDAGVLIPKHVAGIAIGLASNEKGEYKTFVDLQDLEDGPFGMDFKVAGTNSGITAVQMDTKTSGLSFKIIEESLYKAKKAREKILDIMYSTISASREKLSKYAPQVESIKVNPKKIRFIIGPQGKTINEIIALTGVKIDIEPEGKIYITGDKKEMVEKAVTLIKEITQDIKIGDVFEGKVTRILDFGVLVEILPNQEGLLHISNISNERIDDISKKFKIGDKVKVKVIGIDNIGRINLCVEGVRPSIERRRNKFKNKRNPNQKYKMR